MIDTEKERLKSSRQEYEESNNGPDGHSFQQNKMHWCTIFVALAAAAPALSAPVSSPQPASTSTPSHALWLWKSAEIIQDPAHLTKFLSVVANPDNAITRVHAHIDRNVANAEWGSFIEECGARGVAVEALMGDKQWVLGSTTAPQGPTLQRQLDWIEQYQTKASARAKFAGIHMDVEPWGLPGWEVKENAAHVQSLVGSLVAIADKVAHVANRLSITAAADLPFFATSVPCEDATLATCLLGYLDSVTFMTYRQTSAAVLDMATPLLKAVEKAHPGKPTWLAVETCEACDPEVAEISYTGKSVGDLMRDLAAVERNATAYSGFAGVAIHSYEDFVKLPLSV
ncbi:hypothetical protein BDV95DRAFT_621085 [Massariosphaeria phaeospora]|uniref:Glycoside hydrolase superfamily n=1 Tax=Massariosphaeria phaeospora TaxID=100035 RepID=A0A7C8M5I3_9PLEO|nr:hypothetical protein BDV95DRAFT_621085 [Massariosphaeria phaeospora]